MLYTSKLTKCFVVRIHRFLPQQDKVNSIPVELNRANTLYADMKTLRNICFVTFYCRLRYSCFAWAQNINIVRRLIVLQRKPPRFINFKKQIFNSNSLFSTNNIMKFGDENTLENIFLISTDIFYILSLFYIF